MDPAACVREFLSALARRDIDAAHEACRNLREWVARGGFIPYGWTREEMSAFLRAASSLALDFAATDAGV